MTLPYGKLTKKMMDVGKKGTQTVKNKKIVSLVLAMLFGTFQIINAAHGVEIEAPVELGRPSVEPVRPRDTDPARWDLLQRLREQDEALKLGFIKPAGKPGKGGAGVVTPPVVSTPVGVVVDSASLKTLGVSKRTFAKIVEVGKGDHDFTSPDALFLQNGTMASRKLGGKEQKISDPFLAEIRDQMKKQRKTYQKFFSRLSAKQKEQEQKSFEILNTELSQLAKLEKANPSSQAEIAKVKAGIRDLIDQMNKATFNEAAKPVVVEPVDEGHDEPVIPVDVQPVHEQDEDDGLPPSLTPVDEVVPQGKGFVGKPYTREQQEAERALEESILRKKGLREQGTSLVLGRTVDGSVNPQITAAIEKAFGKLNNLNKEAASVAESVLLGDSVVAEIAESRVENQDPRSKQYRADSKKLIARIQKVAQETKTVFALLKAGKSVEEVMDDLGSQIRMIKERIRTGFEIKGGDLAELDRLELDRLELDLKISEFLRDDANDFVVNQILKPKTNEATLEEPVVAKTIKGVLGKSFSDLGKIVYEVLGEDTVISGVTARQDADSDPRSLSYRTATKDLVARVKLVAQEAKKINARLVKEGVSAQVLAKIKANVELNLASATRAGKKDNAVRYQVDLQICEALEKTVGLSSLQVTKVLPSSFDELLADAQKDDEMDADLLPAEVARPTDVIASRQVEVQPVRSAVKTYQQYLDFIAQEGKVEITDAQRETSSALPKSVQSDLEAALKEALKGYKVSKAYVAEFRDKVEGALEKDPTFLKLLTAIKNDTAEHGRQPVALTVDYQLLVARAGKIAKGMQEIVYATEETGTVSSLDKLVAMKKILQGRLKHLFDRNQLITDRQNISVADLEELDTLEMQLRLCDQLEPEYKEEQEAQAVQRADAERVAQQMAAEREKAAQEKATIEEALAKIDLLEGQFTSFDSGHPDELNSAVGKRDKEIRGLLNLAFGPDEEQWSNAPDFKEVEFAYRSYSDTADQDQSATKGTADAPDRDMLELLGRKQNALLAKLKDVFENRLNPSVVVTVAPARVEPVSPLEPVDVQAEPSYFGSKDNPLSPLPKAVRFAPLPDSGPLDGDIAAGDLHEPVAVEPLKGDEEVPVRSVASVSDAVVRSYTNLNESQLNELTGQPRPLTEKKLDELSRSNLEALKQFYKKRISDLDDEQSNFRGKSPTDYAGIVAHGDATDAARRGLELSRANLGLVERVLENRPPEEVVEPVESPEKKENIADLFNDGDDEVVFDRNAPRLDSPTPLVVPEVSKAPVAQSMYQESTLRGMDTSALEGLKQVLLEDTVTLRTKMASDKKAGVDVGELEKSLASSRATYELINKILKELPVTSSGPKPLKKTAPIMIDSAGVVKILLEKTESERKEILKDALVEELLSVRTVVEEQLKQKRTMQLLDLENALNEVLKSRQVVNFTVFTPTDGDRFFDQVVTSRTYETNKNKDFYNSLISRMNLYRSKNLTAVQRNYINKINEQCMALETPGVTDLEGFTVKSRINVLVEQFTDSFQPQSEA